MSHPELNARFFESTRGRVVELLRRGERTVDELAAELELSDNAVRLHLASLQRDGLVHEAGVRRSGGVGKPATLYAVHPDAEPSFSHAYLPLLTTLLDTLGEELSQAQFEGLMRRVGQQLAAALPAASGDTVARVAFAAQLLDDLGGVTEVEKIPGALRISGCACPLSAVVAGHPRVCSAVTTMLGEIVGGEVRECCAHGERPRCCFEIPLPGSAKRTAAPSR